MIQSDFEKVGRLLQEHILREFETFDGCIIMVMYLTMRMHIHCDPMLKTSDLNKIC